MGAPCSCLLEESLLFLHHCHNLKVRFDCVFGLSSLLVNEPGPGLFVHGHIPGHGG